MKHVLLMLAVTLALSFSMIACGGDGPSNDRVLHFTGRDETEGNFRSRIRDTFNEQAVGARLICNQIKDLKPSEAHNILRDDSSEQPNATPIPGTTPKPGQKAVPADLERSAAIVQEECRSHPFTQ